MTDADTSSHVATGWLRVLESPAIYSLFQRLIGADGLRRYFVDEFVRPFPGARILDVGCGTGAILDYLPGDVHYVGLDLNPRYIDSAGRKYQGRGQFICCRVGDRPLLAESRRAFDIVLAMAVLHHLDDDDASGLIRDACLHLVPGGIFASLDGCYHPGQSLAARFLLSRDRGQNIRTPAGYRQLLSGYLSPTNETVETRRYRIPYSLFLLRAVKLGAQAESSRSAQT